MLLKIPKSKAKLSSKKISARGIPESGVKVNELPTLTTIPVDYVFIVADSVTGISYQVTLQQLKDVIGL